MLPVQCSSCQHYKDDNKCKAYPKGIPFELLSGQADHTKPYKGDNGIRFKKKK